MANKKINQLTSKTSLLNDSDYLMVYDSEEAGSEPTKKIPIENFISVNGAAFSVHVATTGSDVTGTGTSGNPFATITGALSFLSNKIIKQFATVTIQLAAGTYNNQTVSYFFNESANIQIVGDPVTPSNVVLNYASGENGILVFGNRFLTIDGITMNGYDDTEWHTGVSARHGSSIQISNSVISNFGAGIQALLCGSVHVTNCTVDGCQYGASGLYSGDMFWYSGTVSNNVSGLVAVNGGRLHYVSASFSGNSNNTHTATGGSITNG